MPSSSAAISASAVGAAFSELAPAAMRTCMARSYAPVGDRAPVMRGVSRPRCSASRRVLGDEALARLDPRELDLAPIDGDALSSERYRGEGKAATLRLR